MSQAPLTPACIAFGAFTALGPSVRHTGFYLRAGRNNFALSPFVDTQGDAISLAASSLLPKHMTGVNRLAALACAALDEALAPLSGALTGTRIQLCFALPDRLRSTTQERGLNADGKELCERISAHLGQTIDIAGVHTFAAGVAAGAPALLSARFLLQRGDADVVLLCGVDSYYDADTLERLEQTDRLMTADNQDALRPGEAAACLVLVSPRHPLARRHGIARLLSVGLGEEPSAQSSEEQTMAKGLSSALREAVTPLREKSQRCNELWCDVTHEASRVRELQILFARIGDTLGFDMHLAMPARELGEVGAATLPLYAALCCEAWRRGYAADTHALCMASSEHGLCGALLLEAGSEARFPS